MSQLEFKKDKKFYNKTNINGSKFYKMNDKIYCGTHDRELNLFTTKYQYERVANCDDGYTCDQCDRDYDHTYNFQPTYNCSSCDMDVCQRCVNYEGTF